MIELRTTVRLPEAPDFIATVSELVGQAELRTETFGKIVLLRIHFAAQPELDAFLEQAFERGIALSRWEQYTNDKQEYNFLHNPE